MAFPIGKVESKTPENLPFPLDYVDPHLIQQCLGPPHAPPQTAAQTVEALSHTYAVKSPLDTMACQNALPKVPLSLDRSANPTTCLIPGPVRLTNSTSSQHKISSTQNLVFPHCTGQGQTDRQIKGSFTGVSRVYGLTSHSTHNRSYRRRIFQNFAWRHRVTDNSYSILFVVAN